MDINAKKCTKRPEHVREEIEDYMSANKNKKEQNNMENQNVNEDLFGFQDEDFDEIKNRMAFVCTVLRLPFSAFDIYSLLLIKKKHSRIGVTNISSGGSN